MSTPTIEDIRDAFESDIPDVRIQGLIDAETEEVTSRFGPELTETYEGYPSGSFISLPTPAALISSVVEIEGTTETTLAANDYRIRSSGWRLERLSSGTNQSDCWARRVLVTYVKTDSARRWRVIIDLVKLALQYDALTHESTGENSSDHVNYQEEREALLRTLMNSVLAI